MTPDSDSWLLDERAHAGREHFDAEHARRYDAKENAEAAAEVRLLQDAGVLNATTEVIEFGAGTGQFTVAVAGTCKRVVAVDVSPIMSARLAEKLKQSAVSNVQQVDAGFVSYRHSGPPVDLVYIRFALHHLPDFWKAIAVHRMASVLRPGGALRLWDVVYHFEPADAEEHIEAWITKTMSEDVEHGWKRSELAEHVRDEHSTFTWLLEPMMERAGFQIASAVYDDSGMLARYLCKKR